MVGQKDLDMYIESLTVATPEEIQHIKNTLTKAKIDHPNAFFNQPEWGEQLALDTFMIIRGLRYETFTEESMTNFRNLLLIPKKTKKAKRTV
jgi:hypothetical protein